jgi:hypothetical protein
MSLITRLAALEHAHSKPEEITRVLFTDDFISVEWIDENPNIIGAINPDNDKQVMRLAGEPLADFRRRLAKLFYSGVAGDSLQMMCEAIHKEQTPCA